MCQKLFRVLRHINLISPKSLGSIDHVYPPYAGKETEEHRNLDHGNSVYLGFSMTFDKISYYFSFGNLCKCEERGIFI